MKLLKLVLNHLELTNKTKRQTSVKDAALFVVKKRVGVLKRLAEHDRQEAC